MKGFHSHRATGLSPVFALIASFGMLVSFVYISTLTRRRVVTQSSQTYHTASERLRSVTGSLYQASRAFLHSEGRWRSRPSLGQIATPEGTCWISFTAEEQVVSKCFLNMSMVVCGLAWRAGWSLGRRGKMRGAFSSCGSLGALGKIPASSA